MQIVFTSQAKKDLRKLHKVSQIIIIEKIKKLGEGGVPANVEKLSGYKKAYRVRVGDYRIVYRIIGKKMYIVLIGHRKNIYEKLKKLLG